MRAAIEELEEIYKSWAEKQRCGLHGLQGYTSSQHTEKTLEKVKPKCNPLEVTQEICNPEEPLEESPEQYRAKALTQLELRRTGLHHQHPLRVPVSPSDYEAYRLMIERQYQTMKTKVVKLNSKT